MILFLLPFRFECVYLSSIISNENVTILFIIRAYLSATINQKSRVKRRRVRKGFANAKCFILEYV